ncbi:MAG: serine hydrolase [Planctomycetota bacterium]
MVKPRIFLGLLPFASLLLIEASQTGQMTPGPVFSKSGPDAAEYGADDGYPVGTRSTFTQVRYLVGAFSHFDQLFPAHVISRAKTAWRFRRVAEKPTITYTYRQATYSIQDYLARHPVTGLLIAKDDTILVEHYQYACTDRDRFLSQSMAKTITGMLIGIAVSEHLIDSIDDPVADYVPELAESEYGKSSIRDLLHMSSGVRFHENYSGEDDDERFEVALLFGPSKSPAEIILQFNNRIAPSGTKWAYASIESYILGLVLRGATGTTVADYLEEKIWKPIGAEADATWVVDVTGNDMTHGFFSAVLRDYARFGRLLAYDGIWEGREVIPRQWILDATTVPQARPDLARVLEGIGYGYQIWILPGERRMFALLGTRGQRIFVDPQSKLVMVNTAVRKSFANDPGVYETGALWSAVVRQFGQ